MGGSSLIREIKPFLFRPLGLVPVADEVESGTFKFAPVVDDVVGVGTATARGVTLEVAALDDPGNVPTTFFGDPSVDVREEEDEALDEEDILRAFFHSFLVPFFTKW